MGAPADVHLHREAPLRLFTEDEANALLPQMEEIFLRLDPKLARLRDLRELVEDSEAYYGEGLAGAPAGDRESYAELLQEQADLDRSVQADIESVLAPRVGPGRMVAHPRRRLLWEEAALSPIGTLISRGPRRTGEGEHMATKEDVIGVLRKCYDPEIPINIYDLGLVYNIDLKDEG